MKVGRIRYCLYFVVICKSRSEKILSLFCCNLLKVGRIRYRLYFVVICESRSDKILSLFCCNLWKLGTDLWSLSWRLGGYQWHKWHNGELANKNFHLCHEILCHLMQFYAILCHSKYEILKLWTENLITNCLHPTSTVHLYLYLLYYNIYFHPLISSKYP